MLNGFPAIPLLVIYRLLTRGLCSLLRVGPVAAWMIAAAALFTASVAGPVPTLIISVPAIIGMRSTRRQIRS